MTMVSFPEVTSRKAAYSPEVAQKCGELVKELVSIEGPESVPRAAEAAARLWALCGPSSTGEVVTSA